MPSKEIRLRYSSRKKRDVVTFLAISMFVLIIAFQLFLILVLPVLLSRKNAWDFQVAREEVFRQVDGLRKQIRNVPAKGRIQQGEVATVKSVVDQFALYTRESKDALDWPTLALLKRIFGQYEAVNYRWCEAVPRYYVVQEQIDMPALIKRLEEDIQE